GEHINIGGSVRRLVRLSSSGTVDATWNPLPDGYVAALMIGTDGAIYAGGAFTHIGGQPRRFLAKLSAAGMGEADGSWDPSPNDLVTAIASTSGGTILVGGYFSKLGDMPRLGWGVIGPSGMTLPDTAVIEGPGTVTSLAVQANGGLIVSGDFLAANG